jgi:tetratricopeptide (TPR) repeat protein
VPPKALPVLLLAGWAALPSLSSLPWDPHLPVWAERWLWNPRERTGQAIAGWNAKDPDAAAENAATALRLAPDDPRVQYNSGTAELGARHLRRSIRLLEKAARDAPPDLASAASYNLGNARLGAGDAAGAVEAYKKALRLAPADANAKHNLEIALRERDKEQMRMKSPARARAATGRTARIRPIAPDLAIPTRTSRTSAGRTPTIRGAIARRGNRGRRSRPARAPPSPASRGSRCRSSGTSRT